jgi:hypothetical protein
MYYGRKFDVKFFQGKFELASVEGSSDDRGCHFVFLKTANQIRTSQLQAAINEYNLLVPSSMAMRLQAEVYQPVIVTMSSRRMEGSIYSKIVEDKQTRFEDQISNYWFWDRERHENLLMSDEAGGLHLPDQARGSIASSSVATARHIQSEHSEFDVVKKRKKIDSASEDGVSAPDALVAFEEFEASVIPALESIAEDENEFRRQEIMEMEESLANGGAMSAATGGVYFAWSQCLGCMKIGATRKEDPHTRLRQLSSFVTTPFVLAAWLPTPRPFQLEAAAHLHFKQQRINQRRSGAGTEFFRISVAEAVAYVA